MEASCGAFYVPTCSLKGLICDEQTGSLWNGTQGIAIDGPLKGQQLDQEPPIITFTHKWKLFHSDSKEVRHVDSRGGHGYGMRQRGLPLSSWRERWFDWMQAEGLLEQ